MNHVKKWFIIISTNILALTKQDSPGIVMLYSFKFPQHSACSNLYFQDFSLQRLLSDRTGRLMLLYVLHFSMCVFVCIYAGTHVHTCLCVWQLCVKEKIFFLYSATSDITILFSHHAFLMLPSWGQSGSRRLRAQWPRLAPPPPTHPLQVPGTSPGCHPF